MALNPLNSSNLEQLVLKGLKGNSPCEQLLLVLVEVSLSLSVTSVAHDAVTVHVLGVSWTRQPVDGSPLTEEYWTHQMEDAVVSSQLPMFLEPHDSVELVCAE